MFSEDELRAAAENAFGQSEPFVTQMRAHAFQKIEEAHLDDLEVRLDMLHHTTGQLMQIATSADDAISFLGVALAEALWQLGKTDHLAMLAMLAEIEKLETL